MRVAGKPVRMMGVGDAEKRLEWALRFRGQLSSWAASSPLSSVKTWQVEDGLFMRAANLSDHVSLTFSGEESGRHGFAFVPASSASWNGWGPPFKGEFGNDINPPWGTPGCWTPEYRDSISGLVQVYAVYDGKKTRWKALRQTGKFKLGGNIAAQVDTSKAYRVVSVQAYRTGWLPAAVHGQNSSEYLVDAGLLSGARVELDITPGSTIFVDGAPLEPITFVDPNDLNMSAVVGIGVKDNGDGTSFLVGIAMRTHRLSGNFRGEYAVFHSDADWKEFYLDGTFSAENSINGKHYPIAFFFKQDCSRASGIGHRMSFKFPTGNVSEEFLDSFYHGVFLPEPVHVDFRFGDGNRYIGITVTRETAKPVAWEYYSESGISGTQENMLSAPRGKHTLSFSWTGTKIVDKRSMNEPWTIAIAYKGNDEKRLQVAYDYGRQELVRSGNLLWNAVGNGVVGWSLNGFTDNCSGGTQGWSTDPLNAGLRSDYNVQITERLTFSSSGKKVFDKQWHSYSGTPFDQTLYDYSIATAFSNTAKNNYCQAVGNPYRSISEYNEWMFAYVWAYNEEDWMFDYNADRLELHLRYINEDEGIAYADCDAWAENQGGVPIEFATYVWYYNLAWKNSSPETIVTQDNTIVKTFYYVNLLAWDAYNDVLYLDTYESIEPTAGIGIGIVQWHFGTATSRTITRAIYANGEQIYAKSVVL